MPRIPAPPLLNTYWVAPGRLLAGEYPRHRDAADSVEKLRGYLEIGVSFFVDLTEAGELEPYAPLFAACTDKTVEHRRFPVRDGDVPEAPSRMAEILNSIDRALAARHLVYVHCWGGVGRTGTVVGCWFARHGQTGQAALDALSRHWRTCAKSAFRDAPEYPRQREYVRAWREGR